MKLGVPTSFGWRLLATGWRTYSFFGRLVAGLYYRGPHQVELRSPPEASDLRLPPPDPALRNPLGKDGVLAPPNPKRARSR